MTANNVTYALLGDSFRYWDFFPTRAGPGARAAVGIRGGRGVDAPTASRSGGRVYGYLPPASHLLVRPGRADARGLP